MQNKTPRSALFTGLGVIVGAVALALGSPLDASAHVSVGPSSTAAGSYTVLSFSVGHGCTGSPTTRLTFTMPAGIDRVTPTVNPNWTIQKIVESLPTPTADSHGANITERVAKVVYTAVTPLKSDERDVVALSLQLPADAENKTIVFPVLQECVQGSIDWNQPTADSGELEHPAPTITVTAAKADSEHEAQAATIVDTNSTHSEKHETGNDDLVARVLGGAGVIIGAVGIGMALLARRKYSDREQGSA